MVIIFWVVAAILTVSGIILLFRKEFKWGIICIIVACIVGPLLANFFGGPPAGPRSSSEPSPSSDAAIVSMSLVSEV